MMVALLGVMKTAAIIVSAIFLLGTAAMGLMGSNRSVRDARSVDEARQHMASPFGGAVSRATRTLSAVDPGRLRVSGVALALVSLLALALLVVVFIEHSIIPHLALAVMGMAVFAVVISPSYDLGPTASTRTLAYVVSVLAVLGATTSTSVLRM